MFIITAKVRKGRIAAVAAAAAVVCGVLVAAAGLLGGRGAAASAAVSPKGVRTNEDRIAYLESYGWSVSSDPIAVEELIIPEQFDETYSQYLELQASQGFDLTDYCGKRVKRYTYEITNYPTGESGIQAGLLVYKSTVIGGDVLSAQLGGFIHGLEMPALMERAALSRRAFHSLLESLGGPIKEGHIEDGVRQRSDQCNQQESNQPLAHDWHKEAGEDRDRQAGRIEFPHKPPPGCRGQVPFRLQPSGGLGADQVDHREFEDITEQIRDPDQPAQQPRHPGHNREHKGRVIALIHPARLIQPHHGQNQRRHNRKQSGRGNYGQNHGHNHKKLPDKNSV